MALLMLPHISVCTGVVLVVADPQPVSNALSLVCNGSGNVRSVRMLLWFYCFGYATELRGSPSSASKISQARSLARPVWIVYEF
jgi:hypothetical protein